MIFRKQLEMLTMMIKVEFYPINLTDATEKMAKSEIAKQLFGEDFVNILPKHENGNGKQYENQVTDWELKRYFEII